MRPLPVTLIGFYQILRGVLYGIFGLSILLLSSLAMKLMSLAAEGSAMQRVLSGFGHMAGIFVLVAAILHLIAGYGLLQMQNWARLLTLLFSAIGIVFLLPFLHAFLPMLFAFINGFCIIYLALPGTKRAFNGQDKPSVRMAA
ncbi:MAG TPA: hypothetical protein VL983_11305 [Terriglobales bacterium]|nr:hypothetical protein [Terriglobales bacterium]